MQEPSRRLTRHASGVSCVRPDKEGEAVMLPQSLSHRHRAAAMALASSCWATTSGFAGSQPESRPSSCILVRALRARFSLRADLLLSAGTPTRSTRFTTTSAAADSCAACQASRARTKTACKKTDRAAAPDDANETCDGAVAASSLPTASAFSRRPSASRRHARMHRRCGTASTPASACRPASDRLADRLRRTRMEARWPDDA